MRLYQKDVYLKSIDTKVLSIDGTVITLEDELFFPEGGGQPCDLGTVAGQPVADVKEDKATGAVLVRLAAAPAFAVGDTVRCELDWARRFRHMQMHCGEHIISGSFYRLYKGENRGFHMDESHVTIDIWLPGGELLTREQIEEAELAANRAIWADTPVHIEYFATLEEAEKRPLRKAIKAEEDISVVTVGDFDDPIDCCACCGTHPKSAGEVGLIKVVKAEKNKGMTRLSVKIGEEALKDYQDRFNVLQDIADSFSTEYSKLKNSLAAQQEKNDAVKRELVAIKRSLLAEELEKILAWLPDQPGHFRLRRPQFLGPDDLQKLALQLEGKFSGVLALVSEDANTVILTSPKEPNCGKLVKENAPIYRGKGGGSPQLARAIFEKSEDMELFLDLIEKHLR